MSNTAGRAFVERALADKVRGASVLEVGAHDVNGSARGLLQPAARSYVGVDIDPGPGVDEVVSVHDLTDRFGEEAFDVVVSAEMIEHVEDWRSAVRQMMAVTRQGGTLLVTTRSRDFPFHAYPHDYWRFEVSDMEAVFTGWQVELLEPDPDQPGVFVAATRPVGRLETAHLDGIKLFSMAHDRRVLSNDASKVFSTAFKAGRRAAPAPVREAIKRLVRS